MSAESQAIVIMTFIILNRVKNIWKLEKKRWKSSKRKDTLKREKVLTLQRDFNGKLYEWKKIVYYFHAT